MTQHQSGHSGAARLTMAEVRQLAAARGEAISKATLSPETLALVSEAEALLAEDQNEK